MRSTLPVLILMTAGCTWVSKDDLNARLPQVDDDGDGVVAAEDCDDSDPTISPNATETWYDGIDSDCAGDHDYDADQDGHVATEYVDLPTQGVRGTGILPGGDCNDLDAESFPGAPDSWYDGIDSDCENNDDYDQDGDGHAAKDKDYGPTANATGTGELPADDCEDTLPEVNPNADDAWYDGIDSNCAGDDDFDQDGDGFYRTNELFYGPTMYADETIDSPARPGDCDDTDATVNPAPGTTDNWYDGIDSDCAGNDDYDRDADGYVPAEYAGMPTSYVDGSGVLPGGDCNDDPTTDGFDTNPGVVEVLSDSADRDCDATDLPEMTPPLDPGQSFRMEPLEGSYYVDLHSLAWGENESGIYLAVGANENAANDAGVIDVFRFDPTDILDTVPSRSTLNMGTDSYDFSSTMSFWVDDDVHLSLTGSIRPSPGLRDLYVRGIEDSFDSPTGATGGPTVALVSHVEEWAHLDDVHILRDSNGDFHTVGCDNTNEVLQYNKATSTSLHIGAMAGENRFTFIGWTHGYSATTCAVFDRDGTPVILSNENGTFSRQTFDVSAADLLLTHPASEELPSPDPRLLTADVQDILVPATRAPASIFLVVDGTANSVYVVDKNFQVIRTRTLPTAPATVEALFGPDGALYVLTVGRDGTAFIEWGDHDEEPTESIQIALENVINAAMWVDDTTNNILQVVAAVEDATTDEDPLFYGRTYFRAASDTEADADVDADADADADDDPIDTGDVGEDDTGDAVEGDTGDADEVDTGDEGESDTGDAEEGAIGEAGEDDSGIAADDVSDDTGASDEGSDVEPDDETAGDGDTASADPDTSDSE